MMAAPAGSAPDLVGYSDDEIDSIEEHEQPSEEDEELVSSWVADLQEQQVQVVSVAALPAVAAAADDIDDDRPVNFEECRKRLDDFFSARVLGKNQTMTWKITENLPRTVKRKTLIL
jgi:hypothetical protein